jgi:hypothetical protein
MTTAVRSTEHVEIASPATWLRCLVRHQTQAERDFLQFYEACGSRFDQNDRRALAIEAAYNELAEGARYMYEQTQHNARISEDWIRTELATTANAYQTFTQMVWEGISAHTQDVSLKQAFQGTQLARLHDALAYQAEANIARGQHLAKFEGDVTNWAAHQTARTTALETKLREAQQEIRQARAAIQNFATTAPLPASRPESVAAPPSAKDPIRHAPPHPVQDPSLEERVEDRHLIHGKPR